MHSDNAASASRSHAAAARMTAAEYRRAGHAVQMIAISIRIVTGVKVVSGIEMVGDIKMVGGMTMVSARFSC